MAYQELSARYEALIGRKNEVNADFSMAFTTLRFPVLTRDHIPPFWMYDPNPETNPFRMQRLGVNAVFNSGAITAPDGKVYIYYASSDTRLHVAVTDLDRLTDYVFHTPADPGRSVDCVKQRIDFIRENKRFLECK